MHWQNVIYLITSVLALVITVALAIIAWGRRTRPGVKVLSWLMVAGAIWSLGYLLEMATVTLDAKLFWARFQYLGIVSVPGLWLLFVLEYTGRTDKARSGWLLLLTVVPLLTLGAVWTNPLHGYFWENIHLEEGASFATLEFEYAPVFWVHTAYSYLVLLLGVLFIVPTAFQTRALFRDQALTALLGVLAIWFANLFYLADWGLFFSLKLAPVILVLVGLGAAWNLLRYRMFSVLPVARVAILERMEDGVLVFDAKDRLVDLNPAAAEALGLQTKATIGQFAEIMFSDHPPLWNCYATLGEGDTEVVLGDTAYDVRLSFLHGSRGLPGGRLVVLREVTKRRKAEAALRRQLDELSVLRAVAMAGTQAENEDALIERATELIGETLYPDSFGILLVDEETDSLRAHPSYRSRPNIPVPIIPLGTGITGTVAERGKSWLVPDVREESLYLKVEPETRSELCVPLKVGERVIGVIDAQCDHVGCFTEADERLLSTFAGQLATAIERYRLFAAEHVALERMRALYHVARSTVALQDLPHTLQTVVDSVAEALPADQVTLTIFEAEREEVTHFVKGGPGKERVVSVSYEDLSQGLRGWALRELEPALSTREASDPRESPAAQRRRTEKGAGSIIVVPLLYRGVPQGTLTAINRLEQPDFTWNDVALIKAMADQATIALENVRLFGELQQRMAELETLRRTSLDLTSSLNLSTVLDSIAEHALELVRAHDCHIFLYEEETKTYTFGTALWSDGRREPAVELPRSSGLTATVAESGEPVVIDDAEHHPLYASPEAQKWRVKAIAGFPLKRAGCVLGVFTIAYVDPHLFSEAELRVLGLLADQAAVAVENARLFEEMERLKHFNESIVQGVAETLLIEDAQGRFFFVNPAVEALLGYTPEELVGKHWRYLVPEEERDSVLEEWAKRFKGIGSQYETTLLHKSGHRVPVIVNARPLFEEGKFTGVLVAFTDITAQKLVEAELESLVQELDAFAHTVAHDLKSPLSTLIGSADVLVDEYGALSSQEVGTVVSGIAHSAGKMDSIIDELLVLASVRKQENIPIEVLDMGEVVEEALERLGHMVKKQQAQIVLPDSWPAAKGYAPWVEEVWLNYLSNAIKYGGSSPQIELGGEQINGEVRFWVRDKGPGIPSQHLAELFTPFTRLGQIRMRGFGLGLSIVRRIVERLGGRVGAESKVGEGSTFHFTLPADDDHESL